MRRGLLCHPPDKREFKEFSDFFKTTHERVQSFSSYFLANSRCPRETDILLVIAMVKPHSNDRFELIEIYQKCQ